MVGKRRAFAEEREAIKQLIAEMKGSGVAGYKPAIEEEKDVLEPLKKRPKVMPAIHATKQKSKPV